VIKQNAKKYMIEVGDIGRIYNYVKGQYIVSSRRGFCDSVSRNLKVR